MPQRESAPPESNSVKGGGRRLRLVRPWSPARADRRLTDLGGEVFGICEARFRGSREFSRRAPCRCDCTAIGAMRRSAAQYVRDVRSRPVPPQCPGKPMTSAEDPPRRAESSGWKGSSSSLRRMTTPTSRKCPVLARRRVVRWCRKAFPQWFSGGHPDVATLMTRREESPLLVAVRSGRFTAGRTRRPASASCRDRRPRPGFHW